VISSLRGTVLTVTAAGPTARAVIEVAGVGYAVAVTPQHALALREGHETLVHTALIVREDELSLCGFASRDELEVFDLLRGVSGVGPKSALGVLAALSPSQVGAAVEAEDDAPFRRVSGIGPKTAKLIVIALAGKVAGFAAPAAAALTAPAAPGAQARLALEGLGFPERRVAEVVAELLAGSEGAPRATAPSDAELIRAALGVLGPAVVR